MKPADKRMQAAFWEDDTYIIELAPGWICHEVHTIMESTKRAAWDRMRDVTPCQCSGCRELMQSRRD